VNFQCSRCLPVSVCSVGTWERSKLLTLQNWLSNYKNHPYYHFFHMLFQAWVAWCSPNQNLGRAQKKLGNHWYSGQLSNAVQMKIFIILFFFLQRLDKYRMFMSKLCVNFHVAKLNADSPMNLKICEDDWNLYHGLQTRPNPSLLAQWVLKSCLSNP